MDSNCFLALPRLNNSFIRSMRVFRVIRFKHGCCQDIIWCNSVFVQTVAWRYLSRIVIPIFYSYSDSKNQKFVNSFRYHSKFVWYSWRNYICLNFVKFESNEYFGLQIIFVLLGPSHIMSVIKSWNSPQQLKLVKFVWWRTCT